MVNINTFEDAKQAVAEDLKFGSWNEMFGAYLRLGNFNPPISVYFLCEKLEEAYALVAEKLADSRSRKAANEAVKAMKEKLIAEGLYELDAAGYFPATQLIENVTLPFPEES